MNKDASPIERTNAAAEKDVEIVTFGCRLNINESELMRTHAHNAGMKDAIIFNTCAVTKEAERQARQAIRKARRENPDKQIIVTGCSAQVNPAMYEEMGEIDQIIGNDLKLKPESWGVRHNDRVLVHDIMEVKETAAHLVDGFEDRTRAFLQVQNGCNHRCTFCIIPYGRGNSRSVPIGVINEQIAKLVEQGYKEVVFTGVDVASYGPDLPGKPTLGQMIRRVLALNPDMPRIRMSSLDPAEFDDDLWDLIANEPRLMPHLHLSLQAGDDMILKRMKRRHLRDDVISLCKRARDLRPDMAFGADIIAGFPTESNEMFENTLRIIDECDLTYLHVFPYSEREGTPAARIPDQVAPQLRKERAARLRAKGKEKMSELLQRNLNKELEIIVEKGSKGHAQNFAPIRLDTDMEPGGLVRVRTHAIEGETIIATVI